MNQVRRFSACKKCLKRPAGDQSTVRSGLGSRQRTRRCWGEEPAKERARRRENTQKENVFAVLSRNSKRQNACGSQTTAEVAPHQARDVAGAAAAAASLSDGPHAAETRAFGRAAAAARAAARRAAHLFIVGACMRRDTKAQSQFQATKD